MLFLWKAVAVWLFPNRSRTADNGLLKFLCYL